MVTKRVMQRIFVLRRFHPKREREALHVDLIIFSINPFQKR